MKNEFGKPTLKYKKLTYLSFFTSSKWMQPFFPFFHACGILGLWPGIEPMPPALEAHHWSAREGPASLLYVVFCLLIYPQSQALNLEKN